MEENPPRDGFFEHAEYLKVRAHAPASYQDVLDFAYYSGWRRNEILHLTWDEVDLAGGVIRLTPTRSKTKTGRVLPISAPLRQVLDRRRRRRRLRDPRVFRRDGVPVRVWRTPQEAG
jgi:integrase